MRKKDFADRIVLVMGLGRFGGGADVVEFAASAGAKVIVTDLAKQQQLVDSLEKLKNIQGIEFHLGSHDPVDFEKADIIVANPAVPPDNKYLAIARKAGRIVTSQINIFFELCPAQIIGITGANGKSTTTSLTWHLLGNSQNKKVWLTGNIGNKPFLTALDKIQPDDLVVIELSSFQVEQLAEIKMAPQVALITNLTPNHLDRYGTFEKYCDAKEHIFKNQKLNTKNPAVSIFNAEDKITSDWFDKYKNDKGRICIKFSADDVTEDLRNCYNLPGRANLSNLAAALAIIRHFGIDDESIKKSLSEFKALPHRLELVGQTKGGVRWYNDSKATTPQSAITALEAFDVPIILIAGGYDKHLPFDELAEKIIEKAKTVVLIGQTAPKIAEAIQNRLAPQFIAGSLNKQTKVQFAKSLAEAVTLANKLSESGDVVLLSPACASYDMFENYEQRGHQFAELVKSLNK
jgi:UDP-N-acetylmuramoylalanine--D-glutamate ligase